MRSLNLALLFALAGLVVSTNVVRGEDTEPFNTVIRWEKNAEAAYAKGLDEHKPIVVVFTCPITEKTCVHCKRIRGSLFSERVQALADEAVFVMVEVNSFNERQSPDALGKQLFERLEGKSTPMISILKPNRELIEEAGRIIGYFPTAELEGHLARMIGAARDEPLANK